MKQGKIHESVYLAEGAHIIGDVTIGEGSSVWYNAVVRGDDEYITLGGNTNIQDGAICHVDVGYPLIVGDRVVVGHGAILHGCTIGSDTLIGMGAIVLNGAKIGNGCIVGAGSLVTGKMDIPDGMMVMGSPAKVVRPTTEEEKQGIRSDAMEYAEQAREELKKQNS